MDATVERKKVGRPPSRKALLTLRLEPEIVAFFRAAGQANGNGWLQEVNDTLKRSMLKRQARVRKDEWKD